MADSAIAEAPLRELLSTFWDVAVVGAGYAGFAAVREARAAGRNALLIDPRCDLLWESSRARSPVAGKETPAFASFRRSLACATGILDAWIDPGSAEWIANELLLDEKVPCLYYAVPVAASRSASGLVASVTFALRDRLAVLSAAQWVDATEDGLLARLCGAAEAPSRVIRHIRRVFFQHLCWPLKAPVELKAGVFGAHVTLEPSGWSGERALRIETGSAFAAPASSVIVPATKALLARFGAKDGQPLATHWSYEPYPVYARRAHACPSPAPNLALAVPSLAVGSFEALADRYELGVQAAAALARLKKAPALRGAKPPAPTHPVPVATREADVFVAGLGTGGLFAAVAAARAGARVLAAEPLPVPGGVPVVGGIHAYYWGCPGGLQAELDAKVKDLMSLFAGPGQLASGYHPLARMLVGDDLLAKAGADALFGAQVLPGCTRVEGGRVVSALVSTPNGVVEVRAKNWIDATGEGFLAESAGTPWDRGRAGDGSLNAFTQSWGAFGYFRDGLKMFISNLDCGHVDPDDSLDMTTARILGTHHLVVNATVRSSNAMNRTTGVMPTVGIRQGKLLRTRYRLTVDDMVERRRFDDAIGFTGGHVDNHSTDFFAEGDDLCFYNWCACTWGYPTVCEIPYRALLPEGLDNLWIACRAGGCTEEASNAFRMQRDFQRTGEAAGLAAAFAAELGVTSDAVPYERLRDALVKSGALPALSDAHLLFGRGTTSFNGDPLLTGPATPAAIRKWASLLGGDKAGIALWRLYRRGREKARAAVAPLLAKGGAKAWNAALLLGAFGDPAAVPRLVKAVEDREPAPSPGWRAIPRCASAAWVLGICGSRVQLKTLAALAADVSASADTRLAALWSAARIAARSTLRTSDRAAISEMLGAATGITVPLRPWERAFVSEKLRKAAGLPPDPADRAALAESPWKLVRRSLEML